mmetsp:Transcript_10838/g.21780  ORF Transcript_10838/g.21780 Transcript_10838/m.21780 type:complete len:351 (+) Transcript_10838:107-1159(+)|eukprot:CAMPEP_0181325194 /NCGR_PEP_ID=MMETSP1101-20121128/20788_1 /TAXON_ID=46948 /ORGANISM="Rhodomonas abbreviata, Strain Caron Lab Isolate" /LENGTH=350 /DNA_ID=CAMNT_0023433471 /DNA_START=106 /DNA_END=1158 /DNA_ORIENTATION=+
MCDQESASNAHDQRLDSEERNAQAPLRKKMLTGSGVHSQAVIFILFFFQIVFGEESCCEKSCLALDNELACTSMRNEGPIGNEDCLSCRCAWNEIKSEDDLSVSFACAAMSATPPPKTPRKVEIFGQGHVIGALVGVLCLGAVGLGCLFLVRRQRGTRLKRRHRHKTRNDLDWEEEEEVEGRPRKPNRFLFGSAENSNESSPLPSRRNTSERPTSPRRVFFASIANSVRRSVNRNSISAESVEGGGLPPRDPELGGLKEPKMIKECAFYEADFVYGANAKSMANRTLQQRTNTAMLPEHVLDVFAELPSSSGLEAPEDEALPVASPTVSPMARAAPAPLSPPAMFKRVET